MISVNSHKIKNNTIGIELSGLDKSNLFIAFAVGGKNGALIPYTIPVHIKLPLESMGTS